MFVVEIKNGGFDWYLRSTGWSNLERADRFETEEAARAALAKAKKFMKLSIFKQATVIVDPAEK